MSLRHEHLAGPAEAGALAAVMQRPGLQPPTIKRAIHEAAQTKRRKGLPAFCPLCLAQPSGPPEGVHFGDSYGLEAADGCSPWKPGATTSEALTVIGVAI
eukprot:scaffold22666_cov44-Prasinocladus_malaysianus.AAC.2